MRLFQDRPIRPPPILAWRREAWSISPGLLCRSQADVNPKRQEGVNLVPCRGGPPGVQGGKKRRSTMTFKGAGRSYAIAQSDGCSRTFD
jgi:hypothetical protein